MVQAVPAASGWCLIPEKARFYEQPDLRETGLSPELDAQLLQAAAFEIYVEYMLVPTLTPRQVVVLDNLAVPKQAASRAS